MPLLTLGPKQHALSLPMFLFFIPQIKHGLHSLNTYELPKSPDFAGSASFVSARVAEWIPVPLPYVILSANLLSQLVCVSGVNLLSSVRDFVSLSFLALLALPRTLFRSLSPLFFGYLTKPPITTQQRVSSVSTQVVLTTRKAISLCFSVWWFGNGWNVQLGLGALMVFIGSFWYTVVAAPPPLQPVKSRMTEKSLRDQSPLAVNGRSTAVDVGGEGGEDEDEVRERERKESRKTRRSRPMQRVEHGRPSSNAGDRKER